VAVYEIPQGVISFDIARRGLTEFYVFDGEGRCLEDLSHGIRPFILDGGDTVAGPLAVAGDKYSGTMNVSHFLLDQLTKLAVYKKYLGEIPRFVLPGDHPYYHSVLSIAGLTERALIPQQGRFSIRSDRLLIASTIGPDLMHPAHLGAGWALDFLREVLPTGPPEGGRADRKIFISRADARARRILNQAEVEAIVSHRGYDIVVPGEMTAREQIRVFGEASHVIGVHGAGLTNVLFCAPGARVLEILPALCAAWTYWVLSTQAGHRYHAVVADDPELPRPDYRTWSHRPEYNNRDLVLPAERLLAALDVMEQA
jgi:capsular polysaccharide biosynthesis protein